MIECSTGAAFAVRKQATEAGILLTDAGSRRQSEVPLPAFVSVRAGAPLRIFTVFDYLNHLAKGVELQRWPRKLVPRRVRVEEAQQPANAAVNAIGFIAKQECGDGHGGTRAGRNHARDFD